MNLKPIVELDARTSYRLRMQPSQHKLWKVAAFLAHSGDSWFWLAGLGLIWLIDRQEWHTRAALLGIAIFILGALVQAIKFTVRRSRPPGEWGSVYRATDPHSFPSGHAARAAMLAVLACLLGPTWFAITVLIWAPLVSLARIITGLHYLSDVVAGISLGILFGFVFIQFQPLLLAWFPFLF
jgi:undecaprenyl-diphosphatase